MPPRTVVQAMLQLSSLPVASHSWVVLVLLVAEEHCSLLFLHSGHTTFRHGRLESVTPTLVRLVLPWTEPPKLLEQFVQLPSPPSLV